MFDEQKSVYPKAMSFPAMVFWTGLFGGIFWGTIGSIAYYFNMTQIRPSVILEEWVMGNWKYGWIGTVVSIVIFGILSIGAAFFYYALLRKFPGMWFGIGYGILLFLIVFFVLNPLFPGIKPIGDLNRDTIISSICLYTLYGIFIGYSINYEYQNRIVQENEAAS
ncbi:YqhR family membrane protein [Bacillus sp. JJ1764]|uniref:YqhR family membrane protein n=1 Tax=Bacillus sp. JJ1764 TaxID=3122964 RepID=UPI002FFFEB2F